MRILLDVMSGDRPPHELIQGGVNAAKRQRVDILFAGDPDVVAHALAHEKEKLGSQFAILPCSQIIEMADSPVKAVREKTDSSMVRGLQALRDREVDAFVSPGNTGAIVAGAIFTLGRVSGIPRPGLMVSLPTLCGPDILVIDVGANSDCQPDHLLHFALMGATYARDVMRIAQPQVALLNIGGEQNKGNRLATEAYNLLRGAELPFAGNVEAHHLITDRPVDVVVCDGFVGNIFLKATEGGVTAVTGILRHSIHRFLLAKLGALLLCRTFGTIRKTLSYQRRGGAPLLGVNGPVVIAHGRSDAVAIESAIDVARREAEAGLVERFARGLAGWSRDGG
jgi:glycerol-3-phosphate acyltransferase PlsX